MGLSAARLRAIHDVSDRGTLRSGANGRRRSGKSAEQEEGRIMVLRLEVGV